MTLKYRVVVDGEVRVEKTFEFTDDVYSAVETLSFDLPEGVDERTYTVVVEACADNVYCVRSRELQITVRRAVTPPPQIPPVEYVSLELLGPSRVLDGSEVPLRVYIRLREATPVEFRDVLYIMADGEILTSMDVSFSPGEIDKEVTTSVRLFTGGEQSRTYNIYAKFMDVESSRVTVTVVAREVPPVSSIVLTLDRDRVLVNGSLSATVVITLAEPTPISFQDTLRLYVDDTLFYTETVSFEEGEQRKVVTLQLTAPEEAGVYVLKACFRNVCSSTVSLTVETPPPPPPPEVPTPPTPPPTPVKPSVASVVIREVSPSEVYPGDSISITYTIYLTTATSRQEVYTGVVRLDTVVTRDVAVSVPPGVDTYTSSEVITLSSNLTPGR